MAIHLKAARVNAGYTQREAAKELNISKGTLVNYEKYKSIPSIEMSQKIASLYRLTVDDIIFFAK
jgi:DNA-binding XRE family transcriptional regulator